MTIPRFALTRESIPHLRKGQETKVYEALTPYPALRSLEELVQRCLDNKFELEKTPAPPSEVWASVLWHLKRLKKMDIAREEQMF
jgi:hypothetical protein